MAQETSIDCPVDFITVNENRIRVTALLVFLLSLGNLFLQHWLVPLFLAIDFYLRAFNSGKFSALHWLSGFIEKKLPIGFKATDRGPKRFAAQIGFAITVLTFICSILGFTTLALGLTAIIVVFAFLESFIGFCAGCYVYSFLKKMKLLNR